MTELAIKKIDLFIGTEHTDLEVEFIKRHIYDAEPKINHDIGINLDDFLTICNRCHSNNGKVVGIETRADSTYPFFHFNWENYSESKYDENWIWEPYIELIANKIENHIIIVMDFPYATLKQYL